MNNLTCDIVRDLLPLYHDGVCSETSRTAVEDHLETCPACRTELTCMEAAAPPLPAETPEPLRAAGRAWSAARKKAFRKGLGIAGGIFLGLALLTFLFFSFYSVEMMIGGSMEPTLSAGDRFLFRRGVLPERGDVVCAYTPWLAEHGIKDVVRIVGVPGDELDIRDGALYVNGVMDARYPAGAVSAGDISCPLVLGEDEYFALGDNLENSFDSRFREYGLLTSRDIRGVYATQLPAWRSSFAFSEEAPAS